MRAAELVPQPGARASLGDRRSLEDQRHRLAVPRECAADELIALLLHLTRDGGEDPVDIAEERPRAGIEHRDEVVAVESLLARAPHPHTPHDVLAQSVGAEERVAVHATADDVAREVEGLRWYVDAHGKVGPRHHRRDPSRDVGARALAGVGRQHRVGPQRGQGVEDRGVGAGDEALEAGVHAPGHGPDPLGDRRRRRLPQVRGWHGVILPPRSVGRCTPRGVIRRQMHLLETARTWHCWLLPREPSRDRRQGEIRCPCPTPARRRSASRFRST